MVAVRVLMQCRRSHFSYFQSILISATRYVKLISSDGHEFMVARDHALTSGTIKVKDLSSLQKTASSMEEVL